jgi:DNA-binding MarR family transcriptional regulator
MNRSKYVNMTDISSRVFRNSPAGGPREEDMIAFAEMVFFAYRDFTGDADAILAPLGFGRAHHRVLHFVRRRPGLRVADLLGILNITKQSLARVLRQLLDQAYVVQQRGETDRRERLLYVTEKGEGLAASLASPQIERLNNALAWAGPEERAVIARFLSQMVSNTQLDDLPAAAE